MNGSLGTPNQALDDSSSLSPSDSGIELLNQLLATEQRCEPPGRALQRATVSSGTRLIFSGQPFYELMLVNAGYLKTVFSDEGGNEQVIGFPVRGDLLGTDGISDGRYINDVVALTEVEVLLIPFTDLRSLQLAHPGMVDSLFRIVSHQLVQEQVALTAIGALSAESRVARFLLKLSLQMRLERQSESILTLQMTRRDIGNYLGMKIETVSRTLSLLASQGMLLVSQRRIELVDRNGLESIAYNGLTRNGPLLVRQRKARPVNALPLHSVDDPPTPWSGLVDLS